jgi:hypothetical protein
MTVSAGLQQPSRDHHQIERLESSMETESNLFSSSWTYLGCLGVFSSTQLFRQATWTFEFRARGNGCTSANLQLGTLFCADKHDERQGS